MNRMFLWKGYQYAKEPFRTDANYTDEEAIQSWIDQVYVFGNQDMPEWILAPKFIGKCASRQRVLEELYYRHQETFYELDLMQIRE
jgi:hypothetical protein